MNAEKSTQTFIWPRRNEFHCLTYAEEGFAPLNIWTRDAGLTKEELVAFTDSVNRRNEPGSLYPRAHISAVPRPLIRDQISSEALCLSIRHFFRANATSIRASKIILDFRTPKVAPFVERAIDLALRSSDISLIDELVVIDA
jgi:hypothetical protein